MLPGRSGPKSLQQEKGAVSLILFGDAWYAVTWQRGIIPLRSVPSARLRKSGLNGLCEFVTRNSEDQVREMLDVRCETEGQRPNGAASRFLSRIDSGLCRDQALKLAWRVRSFNLSGLPSNLLLLSSHAFSLHASRTNRTSPPTIVITGLTWRSSSGGVL